MFGLFSKKAKAPVKAPVVPALIQARSYYGIATHIVETNGVLPVNPMESPALCGYFNWVHTNNVLEVTAEKVEQTLPLQHDNWKWCGRCVEVILGQAPVSATAEGSAE